MSWRNIKFVRIIRGCLTILIQFCNRELIYYFKVFLSFAIGNLSIALGNYSFSIGNFLLFFILLWLKLLFFVYDL